MKNNPSKNEKKPAPNYQKDVYERFEEKPIAYSAGLAKHLGSIKAAILLGQLLYWQGKGRKEYLTYKTIKELFEETALTRKEQERAIKICKSKGYLEVVLEGSPPIRNFCVEVEKILSDLPERDKLKSTNEADQTVPKVKIEQPEKDKTSITESTSRDYIRDHPREYANFGKKKIWKPLVSRIKPRRSENLLEI